MKHLYYARRFWGISLEEKKLFFLGFITLILTYLSVKYIPLKYYLFAIKSKSYSSSSKIQKLIVIKQIKSTLYRLELAFPYKLSCLIKSIVFKILLEKKGIHSSIIFGLIRKNSLIYEAHSIVQVDNEPIYLRKKIDEVYRIN